MGYVGTPDRPEHTGLSQHRGVAVRPEVLRRPPQHEPPPAGFDGEASGFEATLGGLSPVDIIQLKCLRGTTGAIELREEHLFGQVWFERGEIIHAECRLPGATHTGLDAFHCIITWQIGCIRDVPQPRPVRRTMRMPWQQLLMEAEQQAAETALS